MEYLKSFNESFENIDPNTDKEILDYLNDIFLEIEDIPGVYVNISSFYLEGVDLIKIWIHTLKKDLNGREHIQYSISLPSISGVIERSINYMEDKGYKYSLYHTIENGKSKVISNFSTLDDNAGSVSIRFSNDSSNSNSTHTHKEINLR